MNGHHDAVRLLLEKGGELTGKVPTALQYVWPLRLAMQVLWGFCWKISV